MRCKNCGAELKIEDEICPYCGVTNEDAVLHRKNMEKYQKDYEKTKKDIIKQNKNKAKEDAKSPYLKRNIILLIFAFIWPIILISILITIEDIDYVSNKEEALIEEFYTYVQNEEFVNAYYFYGEKDLYNIDGIYDSGFYEIQQLCYCYTFCYENILQYIDTKEIDDYCLDHIQRFYETYNQLEDDNFPNKTTTMDAAKKMKKNIVDLLYVACDFEIPKEDFENLTTREKLAVIERGIKQ